MYARLGFEAGWISWSASVINTDFLATRACSDGDAERHQDLAVQLLDRAMAVHPVAGDAADPAEERQRVAAALRALVPWLHPTYLQDLERFDFAIHCAIAHHRLPAGERLAREARIDAIVDGLLADAPSWSAQCGEGWAPHKTLGILLPDVFLDTHLRTMAARLVSASCAVALVGQMRHPLSSLMKVLPFPGPQSRPSERSLFDIMANLYITRSPADRPAVLGLIGEIKKLKQIDWAVRANQMLLDAQAANVSGVIHGDCLVGILRETLSLKDEQVRQQVVRFQLDQLIELQRARTQQVVQVTIDAVRSGVPLGDPYTAQVRAALDAELHATDGAQRTADARHLLARRDSADAAEHAPPAAEVDHDPVHAWSVDRLAAWIEGPVTRQPIDRQRIQDRERALARGRAQRSAAAAAAAAEPGEVDADPPEAPDTGMEDEDIGHAVDDALRATAAFFRDDLTDMIAIARQLGVATPAIKQAVRVREAVTRLAAPDLAIDDEAAHTLLAQAETSVTELRANVQRSKTSQKQRMAFTQALGAALQQEPMAPGKRQGGVIACPMPLDSWQWVFDTFHGAWLHHKHRLGLDDQPLPLRIDQALALYVTGSSQSGFAFDVSVHLWQRRPDATSPPGFDTGTGLRMNTDDWFDTYIPCAVLHVPLGR